MSKRYVGVVGALAAAMTVGAVATAAPASAVTHTIRKPTLTVVCTEPHHGKFYSAVRFRQHGREFAGSVLVTLTNGSGGDGHAKAEMRTRTGTYGFFRVHRTLHSSNTGPWVAGLTYSWTTAVYTQSAATARRGTVTLTGSC